MSSDASFRYERGTDPAMVYIGSLRATQLILELAGGEVVSELQEVVQPMPEPRKIVADFNKIRSLLGMDVDNKAMIHILAGLGFIPENLQPDSCTFTVPSWRAGDVVGRADLAEEIARIYGLDKLPEVPIRAIQQPFAQDACYTLEVLRNQLVSAGLYEVVNTSMLDEKSATADGIFTADDLIRMNNPISLDLAVMRPSLLPGVLSVIRHNVAHKNPDLAIFEVGHVFCKNQEKYPEERDELVIALTGRVHPERYSGERAVLYDFYDLKGVLESVLDARRIGKYSFETLKDKDPRFIEGRCAELKVDGKRIGVLGEAVPALSKGMRLNTPLDLAVIQLPGLLNAQEKSQYYMPISQFPATARDVAFLAPSDLENKQVIEFIQKAGLANLERVELFDIFEGDSLGAGKKSMAYSLIFRAQDRTLTDEEVNKSYEKIRMKLEKGLGVELR